MGIAGQIGGLSPCIGKKAQWARCGDFWVELAQGPGSEIARVGVDLLSLRLLIRVQLGEGGVFHIDFAPDFEDGRGGSGQAVRDIFDRSGIGGDVFPFGAITASGRLDQFAVLVAQSQRNTVDLWLGRQRQFVFGRKRQEPADAVGEIAHILVVERVRKRQHGHAVADLRKTLRRGRANRLGRGIRVREIRVGGFQRGKARLDRIVVSVRDFWRIVGVIGGVRLADCGGKQGHFGLCLCGRQRCGIIGHAPQFAAVRTAVKCRTAIAPATESRQGDWGVSAFGLDQSQRDFRRIVPNSRVS